MEKAPERAAALGRPSYVWRSGQERRLALIRRQASLEGARILDVGCGVGAYVRRMGELSGRVYGVDVDEQRVRRGSASVPNLMVAAGEHLPFRDDSLRRRPAERGHRARQRRCRDAPRGLPRRPRRAAKSSSSRRTASIPSRRTASTLANAIFSATYPSSTTCPARCDVAWRRTSAPTVEATSSG